MMIQAAHLMLRLREFEGGQLLEKKTIKDENKRTFQDIDAKALKLWKAIDA